MAKITLEQLSHSYMSNPLTDEDWALKDIDLTWSDGGAYALLGSSGCGKTTMLNIISGLLTPSKGRLLFDDNDVTSLSAEQRNIAQVFQFPVVYDTMTVRNNLAFPLRNRGVAATEIDKRVERIASMLDLESTLDKRAAGLTADGKQKISLGRGLVRSDVNAILFDEPLTVIDPHLKWQLRSKLKELHQEFESTMIYVTHDQTEALTFADQVVVMHEGMVVQSGTPIELFEQPQHTFVGHFIGSPGMNLLPALIESGRASFGGEVVARIADTNALDAGKLYEVGIRPEYARFSESGIPVTIDRVDDLGRLKVVNTWHQQHAIKLVVLEGEPIPESNGYITFDRDKTCVYKNGWRVEAGSWQ